MRFTHNTHDTSMLYFSVFLSKVMSFVCSVSQFTQEIALEEEKKTCVDRKEPATNRLKNSFFPRAVTILNSQMR